MTTKTTNYSLEKYEPTESPDLQTGYNASMDIIDTELKTVSDAVEAVQPVPLPDGMSAFLNALGITASNAATIGSALKRLANKDTDTENSALTVDGLAKAKITSDGFVFVEKDNS